MAAKAWIEPFLQAVAAGSSVTGAATQAGVARSTVYERLHADDAFRVRFDDAREQMADKLEDEGWRRAHDGWDEPVFHQGEMVGTVRRYSTPLLIFMLKAIRPAKYREHVKHEHGGADGGPVEIRFSYDPK